MMALKGNLPEKASLSFRQALALNPYVWEAFEGLCALGLFFAILASPSPADGSDTRIDTRDR